MYDVLTQLKQKNPERCKYFGHTVESMPLTFWACAVGGETGELLNLIKKQERGDLIQIKDIAYEMADIIIYLDLLATKMGINLTVSIVEKFNQVSDRVNSPIKIK